MLVLTSCASIGSWAWAFNLRMLRLVVYHFASATASPSLCQHWQVGSNLWPWDDELIFLPLCCSCRFSFLVPAAAAGFKPSTLGWWGKLSTTLPVPLLLTPCASRGGWTRTFNLGMVSLVPYHCATIAGSHSQCQQRQLDSNLQPWDDEASCLPLCQCHCFSLPLPAGGLDSNLQPVACTINVWDRNLRS